MIFIASLRTGLVAAGLLVALASPASAEWRRAESERFIVYGEDDETSLRAYVRKLETFDRVLRRSMDLPMEPGPPRRMTIYIARDHEGLETVLPGVSEQVAGFYLAGEEDIFAVGLRELNGETTVLHEYAHHFMYQNLPAAYPGWFVEGFATYYATAEIGGARVDVGLADRGARYQLNHSPWMPVSDFLAQRAGDIEGSRATYYSMAWLLTHWLVSDPGRKAQLTDYLQRVGQGEEPVAAMEQALGMNMAQLNRTLRAYVTQRLAYRRVNYPFPEVPVTVTTLPRSADELLLINQRLKVRVEDDDKPVLIARVRQIAALYPDDVFARRVLARAEITAGDPARAEPVLTALLAADPDDVEALQLMARLVMLRADEDADLEASDRLQVQAQGLLGRARAADPFDYVTLLMIADSRRTSPQYPTDEDVETLRLAQQLAPQLESTRLNLSAVLLHRGGSGEEVVTLLEPVANDPHNQGLAETARQMIDRADTGTKP